MGKTLWSAFLFLILINLVVLPAVAAVEGKIAFASKRDGNYEIYLMNPDGTGQTRLTNNSVYDGEPDRGLSPQARNVSPVYIFPDGYLPLGTPVTASFTINVTGLYPSDGEERLVTDLDYPNWTYTIVVNGVENNRPLMEGNTLTISGFELTYKTSDVVSARVTLQGNAPRLDSSFTNFTVVKIQSIGGNNQVIPGSVVTVEGQTAATHRPVTDFINSSPTSGVPPLVVGFWDISTNYPYLWNWSFGDGTWFNYSGLVPLNPIHTYSDPGAYTVSLTATNARGSRTTTKTGFITVRNSTSQIGIFRPSTGYWYLDNNLDGNVDKSFRYGGSTDRIIVLKWQGNTHDSIAIFRPSTGYWYIDYAGQGIVTTSFRYGGSSDQIIAGDWQGTRRDGIAIFRPSTGYWYFDYDLNGFVDKSFRYGGSTDQIIAGDWQGARRDGIAIFRPSTGYWYFDNNLDGNVDNSFRYGGPGDRIISGDWDGDGSDGIAIFRPSTGYWYFDDNLDGNIDNSFRYGGSTDQIVSGDWNGDGSDGIAIFRPSTGYWYFDYNLDGKVDKSFRYGGSTDRIIVGRWASPSWLPQQSTTITFTRDLTILPGTTASIPVGGKVIWKNEDPLKPHGIAAVDSNGAKYFGGLTNVQIPYNTSYEVTFDTAGTFLYKTIFEPETTGRIIVTASQTNSQGITSISPVFTNSPNVQMIIAGSDFQAGCKVKLTRNTGPIQIINVRDVRWDNPKQVTAWITVSKGSNGFWNVVVTNPDGTIRYLEKGFEVNILS
jgi:PKD repeat protein